MARPDVSIDPQLFARTASLFAAKREALPTEIVRALANDIVRRLARTAFPAPIADPPVTDAEIAAFCDVLIEENPAAALDFIDVRRKKGLTRQAIQGGYIAAAARLLGARWDEDTVSFIDVTVGTGHLYALMRALRAEGAVSRQAFDGRRHGLFATVPGEDHGIGITLAADYFRQAGWQIDLQTGAGQDALIGRIERDAPAVIGLSLSTEERLHALIPLIVAARLAAPEAIIGVAAGPVFDAARLSELADVDVVFSDAASACAELERRLGLTA